MKKAIIFGAGYNYEVRKSFYNSNYRIVGIIDNNYAEINNPEVFAVDYILEKEYDKIIITPKDCIGMYEQLVGMGVPKEKILIDSIDFDKWKSEILGNSYWGQHADDLIIQAIFARIGIEKPSYMDLGCNHPIKHSNTISLYKNGCRGINVDANSYIMDWVSMVKPEDINLNVGVAAKEGTLPFYIRTADDGRNTFSKKEVEEWNGVLPMETVEVKVTTLEKIIDEYCKNGFPDFLDCDIEGLDYEVLDSYDLKNNGPKVICVEVRPREIDHFDEMLSQKGYYKFCRIGENNIYVQKQFGPRLSYLEFS